MRVDHREVQIAFHEGGVTGVRTLIDSRGVSRYVLKQAITALKRRRVDGVDELEGWLKAAGHMGTSKPQKPQPGDSKDYKVQEVDGTPFIRLPVGHMDVCRGDVVRVDFYVGGAKVS